MGIQRDRSTGGLPKTQSETSGMVSHDRKVVVCYKCGQEGHLLGVAQNQGRNPYIRETSRANTCSLFNPMISIVTGFRKTNPNHTFGISRITDLKYLTHCESLLLGCSHAKFAV